MQGSEVGCDSLQEPAAGCGLPLRKSANSGQDSSVGLRAVSGSGIQLWVGVCVGDKAPRCRRLSVGGSPQSPLTLSLKLSVPQHAKFPSRFPLLSTSRFFLTQGSRIEVLRVLKIALGDF